MSRSALETAHHIGSSVAPRPQLVRTVKPASGRMIGKHQRFALQRLQKAHASYGVGFPEWWRLFAFAIESGLKLGHQTRLIFRRRDDDAAVFRRGNVPFEPLKHDDFGTSATGRKQFFVGSGGDDFFVRRSAVIGDDAESEAISGRSLNLRQDLVAAVGTVLGMDVVIASEPQSGLIRRGRALSTAGAVEWRCPSEDKQAARVL